MLGSVHSPLRPIHLASALDKCRDFLATCDTPPRAFPLSPLKKKESEVLTVLIDELCSGLQIDKPVFHQTRPNDANSLDVCLSRFLPLTAENVGTSTSTEKILRLFFDSANQKPTVQEIRSRYNRKLRVSTWGEIDDCAVLIVPPSGVPVPALHPLMHALGRSHMSICWESLTLFGRDYSPQKPLFPVQAIAEEIVDIVQGFSLPHVHLVAVCGGAAPALCAASELGDCVSSLTLCHGDLKVGELSKRTPFQKQFSEMLKDARDDLSEARKVHRLMLDPGFAMSVPADLGPFVLYPYTNLSLMRRYAVVNSALMSFDAAQIAAQVKCPVLLLTSSTDRMAHPEPSHQLAALLPHAELHERKDGEHLDALREDVTLFKTIANFISGHSQDISV